MFIRGHPERSRVHRGGDRRTAPCFVAARRLDLRGADFWRGVRTSRLRGGIPRSTRGPAGVCGGRHAGTPDGPCGPGRSGSFDVAVSPWRASRGPTDDLSVLTLCVPTDVTYNFSSTADFRARSRRFLGERHWALAAPVLRYCLRVNEFARARKSPISMWSTVTSLLMSYAPCSPRAPLWHRIRGGRRS
jgi:hypothetical protein